MSRLPYCEGSSRLSGDGDCSLHAWVRGAYVGVRPNGIEGRQMGVTLLQPRRRERRRPAECDGVNRRVEVGPCDSVANSNSQC